MSKPKHRLANPFATHFRLMKPCANCPFLKKEGIDIGPQRLAEIQNHLLQNDRSTFQCHKTVHHPRLGGDWHEDGTYKPSGQEAMCAGAMIWLEKMGRPTVSMRIAHYLGVYEPEAVMLHASLIV